MRNVNALEHLKLCSPTLIKLRLSRSSRLQALFPSFSQIVQINIKQLASYYYYYYYKYKYLHNLSSQQCLFLKTNNR